VFFILLHLLHLLFIFTYIQNLVLDNHSVELGTQDKEIILQVADENEESFLDCPREFDINPKFPRGENLLLLQYSTLRVPTKWHIA
jgi:hypothetical protein